MRAAMSFLQKTDPHAARKGGGVEGSGSVLAGGKKKGGVAIRELAQRRRLFTKSPISHRLGTGATGESFRISRRRQNSHVVYYRRPHLNPFRRVPASTWPGIAFTPPPSYPNLAPRLRLPHKYVGRQLRKKRAPFEFLTKCGDRFFLSKTPRTRPDATRRKEHT